MNHVQKRTRRAAGGLLAAVALVGTAACGGQQEAPASGSTEGTEVEEVTIGTLTLLGQAPVYIAESEGYYEEAELDVTVSSDLTNPANAIPNVLGGDYDFATVNTMNLMQGLAQGLPVTVVGPVWANTPEFGGVWVKEDSDIQSFADLAGKRVGVFGLGNIQNVSIAKAAQDEGIDPAQINFTEAPAANLANLVKGGEIDAAGLQEPFVTMGREGLRSIGSDIGVGLDENALVVVVITSQEFAQKNPEAVERMQRALAQANEFAASNPEGVRSTMVDVADMDPTLVEQLALPLFPSLTQAELMAELENQAQVLVDIDQLDEAPDLADAVLPQASDR